MFKNYNHVVIFSKNLKKHQIFNLLFSSVNQVSGGDSSKNKSRRNEISILNY